MTFDLVYKEIGELGLYQKYILLLGWLTDIFGGLIFLNSVFLLYIPDHRCAIPGYENDTYEIQNEIHKLLINATIPPSSDDSGTYDKCHVYSPRNNGTEYGNTSKALVTCSSWVYGTSVYTSTIGIQMNLVCDRAFLKSSAQMAFFIGYFIGSISSGLISDRFGRKPTFYGSIIILTLVCLSIAWTPNIELYLIQTLELVGPSKRRYAGQIPVYFWITGTLLMAGLAYLIRDWSMFQIACSVPGFILWSYWMFYPESPRWLYTQGRLAEMEVTVRKAASVNKVTLPDGFFETLPEPKKETSNVAFFKLFAHKIYAMRIFVLYFNWFSLCLVYYGLALNSDSLGSTYGVHLTFFLQMLVDIPGCLATFLLIDRTGRKSLLIVCMLGGGVACIVTMLTIVYGGKETSIATLIFALIGKLAVAAGFKAVYQLSLEIFPTVARNAGFGSCSCVARIGGIVAPVIADLDTLVGGRFGKGLPLLVFGVLAVTAGLLAFLLPETVNKCLTETIEEELEEERKVFYGNRSNVSGKEGKPMIEHYTERKFNTATEATKI